ncbi:UNVERIFIED_CONTAM: hypothetical protein Sangu_0083700 [Sesamum angustifolium]|uniref:Uncharacterized protein n=1 Tax=Sesamum angustifolium TaxID=2727405 RepID=A0AAW2RJF5_9LAMI
MAYAALVSLAHTLEQIMNHHQYCSIPLICEEQLLNLSPTKLSFLQAFLEDYSQRMVEKQLKDWKEESGTWPIEQKI